MATAKLRVTYVGTNSVYAIIQRISDAAVWDVANTTWATWANGSIGDYDIAMSSAGGDLYTATFPTAIEASTAYRVTYYSQAGANPAITDNTLDKEDAQVAPATVTASEVSTILAIVQAASDIGTNDPDDVDALIGQAKEFIRTIANLPQFPTFSKGYSLSGASATEDISGLANNTLWLSLHGSDFVEIELTLANCTTGATTAAEMQTQIRAADVADAAHYTWEQATVTWSSGATQYTITDPTYGEDSAAIVTFAGDEYEVAQALKLSPDWGGREEPGTARNMKLDSICAQMVIDAYRAIKLAPESYADETQRVALMTSAFNEGTARVAGVQSLVSKMIVAHRRLY